MKIELPNWALTLIAIMAAVVMVETPLALFWPQKIVKHPYHEMYHPVLGWVNKPNMRGDVFVTRDFSFYRSHNGQGLRALREIPYEKQGGGKRVLLLGDSFFWGFGVNDRDVVSEIMQRDLDGGFEIINGGASGYGIDQELLWLTEEGLKYSPDIVVLGFFPTNDIDELSTSVSYGYPKPYFGIVNGRLELRNVPVPDTRETRRKAFEEPSTLWGRIKKFLRHNTHIYPLIAGRLNSIPGLRDFFLAAGLAEEYTRSLPGITPVRLDPDRVQDLADLLLLEIKNICAEKGIRFLLVHIPRREQGPDGRSETVYGMDAAAWNNRVSSYLKSFTARNKIGYLDLLPVFRQREADGTQIYNRLAEDHHWTPLGHAAAAEAVAARIRRSDLSNAR